MKTPIPFIFLAASVLFIPFYALSQDTLPNQDFENWAGSGKPAPHNWVEPQSWTSTNAALEHVTVTTVTKTMYNNTTSFQVSLQTFNDTFAKPTAIVNGKAKTGYTIPGYIDFLSGGTPISSVKNKLYGSYLYTSDSANDVALVKVLFKKYNTLTGSIDTIAYGEKELAIHSSGFGPFVVDIALVNAGTPDSVIVGIYSNKFTVQQANRNSSLAVDYVRFEKPAAINEVSSNPKIRLYPNPTRSQLLVETDISSFIYKITDVTGKTVLSGSSAQGSAMVAIDNLSQGYYILNIESEQGFQSLSFVKE